MNPLRWFKRESPPEVEPVHTEMYRFVVQFTNNDLVSFDRAFAEIRSGPFYWSPEMGSNDYARSIIKDGLWHDGLLYSPNAIRTVEHFPWPHDDVRREP